jgi:UDP-N-acetylmuramoyl-L-alanyl-D-glutamate--2,6-diaminopimelate ligase
MANIATTMSDKVIITSDNPRSEDPTVIIAEMEKGVEPQNHKKHFQF